MRVTLGLISLACLVTVGLSQVAPKKGDWPEYGRDSGGSRYSPLAQINTGNVDRLDRAWTYHTGEIGRSFEATPILVNNVLYLSTPKQNVVALNPETGAQIWKAEIWKHDIQSTARLRESRGVAYWPGDRKTSPRILFGTGDGRLIALDAKTGALVTGFGNNGCVDLRIGVADKFPKGSYGISSPPTIYRDVVIVGPATQEGRSHGPSGDVRGYNVRTGKLLWTFHTVPRPGEPGNKTWGPNGWVDRAGPSQWGPRTVDTKLGLIYIPIGNPAGSFYGGDRPGNNLYSASIVALDALTGKLRWARQIVHHDLWDYDMSAPPALVEVKRNGHVIPALAEMTKQGLLFILDRRTGKPVFGIEEHPVPKGDVPGEWYSPTQPFPVKPPPLAPMSLNANQLSKRSPEAEKFCSDWFATLHNNGPFTPFGTTPTLVIPGTQGGGNWGGVSFDPKLGLIFTNADNIGAVGRMVPWTNGTVPYRNDGGYTRFMDQQGYPCTAPPWALLSAVNANTGDIAWQSVLGSYDELEAQGLKNTGAIAMGGSIATAGNLVFIAATTDSKFRAFDARNGKELWVTKLDASGTTVPMTYMGSNGKQYVVVAAGGTNRWRMIAGTAGQHADALIAFALSDKPKNNPSISGSQPVTAPRPQAPAAPQSTAAAVSPAKATSNAGGAAASLPDGEGKALVLATCTKCHGTGNFTSIRMDRSGWEDEVKAMRDKGAVGTDEDFKKIIDYLARNFPRQ